MYFIELLVIHSLFSDSAEITKEEYIDIKSNLTNIAHNGRVKNNKIIKKNKTVILENELNSILDEINKIAKIMSSIKNDKNYEICKKTKKENLR